MRAKPQLFDTVILSWLKRIKVFNRRSPTEGESCESCTCRGMILCSHLFFGFGFFVILYFIQDFFGLYVLL